MKAIYQKRPCIEYRALLQIDALGGAQPRPFHMPAQAVYPAHHRAGRSACATPADHTEAEMLFNRSSIGAIVTAAALAMTVAGAAAFDESKYPDWSGQWQRPRGLPSQMWATSGTRPGRRASGNKRR